MSLFTAKNLTPAQHALLEMLWGLLSGAIITSLGVAEPYLQGSGSIDTRQVLNAVAYGFLFAVVHGLLKLARASTDPGVQAIGTVGDQVVTQVQNRIANDGGKGATFPNLVAPQVVRTSTPPSAPQNVPQTNWTASGMNAPVYQSQPDPTINQTARIATYQPQPAPTLVSMNPTQQTQIVQPAYQQNTNWMNNTNGPQNQQQVSSQPAS